MKFLADAMLGKLTRFLRIFGFDTVYAIELRDYYLVNPVPDKKLIEYAKNSGRILITKDFPLHICCKEKNVYLTGQGVYSYLEQLHKELGIEFDFNINKARCSLCNEKLNKVEDKDLIKDLVLKETFCNIDEFYQCSNPQCKKIYWEGTHIEDIMIKLKQKFEID